MDKNQLQALIEDWKSLRQIAVLCNTSYANTRYWLRKYGLHTKRGPRGKLPKDFIRSRHCPCGETDPNLFYGNKHECKACADRRTVRLAQGKRKRAVDLLGGACVECGYNQYLCSLDMHHTDPQEKDPSFSSWRNWSWCRIVKELGKCILLCKNCHAATHAGFIGE